MKRNSLNQAYRLVWNHTRNCWMAVAETCRSRGKSGRSGGVVAAAVVAALGALGSQAAMADSCTAPSGSSAFVTDSSDNCELTGSESVSVSGGVSLAVSSASAISVTGTSTSIANSGSVSSSTLSAIHNVGTINSLVNTGRVSAPSGSSNGVDNATISSLITSLSNAGTIGGNTAGVRNAGTVGALINAATGSILGNASGISSSGTVGTLTNLGAITGGSDAGIVGTGGSFASIVNSGTVQGLGGESGGISLYNTNVTSSISNTGLIAGQSDAVIVGNGSSVNALTNTNLIAGSTYSGVFVDGGAINTITNGSRAVTSTLEGTVSTVQVAGSITGAAAGIEIGAYGGTVTGYVGAISNIGLIQGGGTMAGILNEGGSVSSIANSAQVFSNTVGGTVSMATLVGSITGGSYGITNRNAGTATGYIDTISNTGVISGNVAGIHNEGGDIGTITNGLRNGTVMGSITGEDYGVSSSGTASTIDLISNAGLISGSNTGIYASEGTLGSVVNTGTIMGADSVGIDLNQTVIESITNAGLITGGSRGIEYDLSGTVTPLVTLLNLEGGTITAGNVGINIGGGTVSTLSNEGLIARLPGGGSAPLAKSIKVLDKIGSFGILNEGTIGVLSNTGTIGVAGTATVAPTVTATIAVSNEEPTPEPEVEIAEQRFEVGIGNYGTIHALSNTDTILALDQGISNSGTIGTLVNSEDGTVSGEREGVYNNGNGTIGSLSNSGLLEGVSVAGILNYGTINALNNAAGATITGGEDGIYTDGFVGGLSNSGLIQGVSGSGIANYETINGLSNSGTITGVEVGLSNTGTIVSLNNYGQIEGTGTLASGISNSSSGRINTLYNGEDGVITGTDAGIANAGTISSLNNGEDGTISGAQNGVSNTGTIGQLSNSGLIDGTTVSGIRNSGTISFLTNAGDGVISSAKEGISNTGTIGTLSNSGGAITGGTDGIFNTGTITLLSNAGQIDGGGTSTGIYNTGTIVGLVNSGKIDGGTATGVYNSGTISSLNNTEGGTITAGTYAVFNTSTIGSVSNAGLIDATNANDLAFRNTGTIISGISNSGTIAGTLLNNNRILSSTGDAISNSGTVVAINNTIDSVIRGDDDGIDNDGTINTLSNSGLIAGEFGSGIYNDGTITSLINASTTSTSGTIVSTIAGIISGEDGVNNDAFINSLSNSGLIEGTSYSGIYNDGTIGSLTNASGGSITGADRGLWNQSSINSLSNSGLIEGQDGAGIENSNFSTINGLTNASGGSIVGYTGVDNNGTIMTLSNSGVIEGTFSGIYNGGKGGATINSLSNSGLIEGDGEDGVFNSGTITSLSNLAGGTIRGEDAGIDNQDTIGSLSNSGLVTGDSYGIYNDGTIGSLSNSGTIVGGDYAIYNDHTITDGITNTGTLDGDVNVGSATLNLRGTTARVIGTVWGSGQVLVGDGTATAFFQTEGNISVSGGVTVNPAATLALHDGAEVGFALLNAGKVFVDSGIDSLSVSGHQAAVNGNYTQTGVLSIGARSASNYGQLTVSGVASLSEEASFDVDVKSSNTLTLGETLHNVLSAGTLTGTSANDLDVTDNSFLLEFDAVHDGNTVDLNVTYTGIGAAMQTLGFTPGTGAGNALDSILQECTGPESESALCGTMTGYLNQLLQANSAGGVANLVGEALPLMQSNMQLSLLGAQQQITNLIEQRQIGGQASGDGWLTQRQMWFKPLASRIEQDNVGGAAGFKANTGGFVIGAEGSLDATNRLGLALAYTNTRVKGQTSTMTHDAKFDGYQLIAYGSSAMPMVGQGVDMNWQADVGFGSTKGSRSALGGAAYSDYKSQFIHVGAGLSRNVDLGEGVSITPSVRADYTTLRDKAYTETGSGALTLAVNKRTTDQFIVSTGIKANKQLDTQWLLTGSASLGVDLINEASTLAARFTAGGPLFSTAGIKPKAWVGGLGLNLQYKPSETVTWDFGYDMSTRSNYMDQTLSVKIKWAF